MPIQENLNHSDLPNLTYEAILKLPEGAHIVCVNAEKCMVIRLRQGYTLTTVTPDKRLRVQYYSERAHLFWEDIVENAFRDRAKRAKRAPNENPDH